MKPLLLYLKNHSKQMTMFKQLKVWSHMPALLGWISLSCGIVFSSISIPFHSIQLYNNTIFYAIILLLIISSIIRFKTVRCSLFFIIGFLIFSYQTQNEDDIYKAIENTVKKGDLCNISGNIISIPILSRGRYSFLISTDSIYSSIDTIFFGGKTLRCFTEKEPLPYAGIHCVGYLYKPRKRINPYGFNEYEYLLSNRIYGSFYSKSFINNTEKNYFYSELFTTIRKNAIKTISYIQNEPCRSILRASFLGEKQTLTSSIKSQFRDAGIYHLLAISGLHVAILISSVLLILSFLPIPKFLKTLIALTTIWCYLIFIGFIPSLFRAIIMATIILLSTLFQKRHYGLNSLGIAGIVWLILSPHSLFTPGFQLSFAATFGILVLYPTFKTIFFSQTTSSIKGFIWKQIFVQPFFISLSAFIATLPVIIYHFGRISLFGLMANIFAVLLMTLAMNCFFISMILQFLFPILSSWLMQITTFFIQLLINLAETSFYFNWASISTSVPYPEHILSYIILFVGFASVGKKQLLTYCKWAIPIFLFVISMSTILHTIKPATEILLFNSKGSQLIGIRFPNNKIWLVGPSKQTDKYNNAGSIANPWFRHKNFKSFDAIILPSYSQNMAHDLDPIFKHNIPKTAITCITPENELERSNNISYFNHFDITHVKAKQNHRFIIAPKCTCTIIESYNTNKRSENNRPVMLKFSFDKIALYINTNEKFMSEISSLNKKATHLKTSVYLISQDTSIFQNTPTQQKNKFSPTTENSIKITIRNNRISTVL